MNNFVKKAFALCLAAGVASLSVTAFAGDVPQLSEGSFETVTTQSGLAVANPIFTDAENGGNVLRPWTKIKIGLAAEAQILSTQI